MMIIGARAETRTRISKKGECGCIPRPTGRPMGVKTRHDMICFRLLLCVQPFGSGAVQDYGKMRAVLLDVICAGFRACALDIRG